MSLYKALIDFRDNENNPFWVERADDDNIVSVKTVVKTNRGKSLVALKFDLESFSELFLPENEENNNKFLISVSFGRGYYGDSVFVDTGYFGEEEMKEGYIFRHFSDESLKKLNEILIMARPDLANKGSEVYDEVGPWLLSNFSRQALEICSTYSYEYDECLVAGVKDYVIGKLCKRLSEFMMIESKCGSLYYTTVNNLLKLWDKSELNKDATMTEVLKKLILDSNLELDEDLYDDYYAYWDNDNFDQPSFNRTVDRELDKIEEIITDQLETGEFAENKKMYDFIISKKLQFDSWNSFPKEKTFGEKNKMKFRLEKVEDGKVHIITNFPTGTRGAYLDLEQFKNFLYQPELF
jgi:hypothetical protein